jgi:hypothetical protein
VRKTVDQQLLKGCLLLCRTRQGTMSKECKKVVVRTTSCSGRVLRYIIRGFQRKEERKGNVWLNGDLSACIGV